VRVGLDVHTLGRRQTGNETYIRELVSALAALADPEVEYVCYHTSATSPNSALPGRVRRVWPHTPIVRLPVSFPIALHRDRVDVAHFQYVAPPVTTARVVLMVHDISFESNPEFLPRTQAARLRWLVPQSIRGAAQVLTVSEFTRRKMVETYRIPPDRITVTPEAAGAAFVPMHDEAAAQTVAAAGCDVPSRFILAVGNVQPRKNLRTLLDAYATLIRSGRIAHKLVLVGQRHYRGHAVFDRIARLGIADHVVWTGYVEERVLVALYNLADLFVFPTLYEGFGLPVLEAMACGTPVVSTNVAAIPEVSGDAAILVDPRSVVDMANAIEQVATDPEVQTRLRDGGFRQTARFDWRTTAAHTLRVYKQCA